MRGYVEYNPKKPKIFKADGRWGVIHTAIRPIIDWRSSFDDAVNFVRFWAVRGWYE